VNTRTFLVPPQPVGSRDHQRLCLARGPDSACQLEDGVEFRLGVAVQLRRLSPSIVARTASALTTCLSLQRLGQGTSAVRIRPRS